MDPVPPTAAYVRELEGRNAGCARCERIGAHAGHARVATGAATALLAVLSSLWLFLPLAAFVVLAVIRDRISRRRDRFYVGKRVDEFRGERFDLAFMDADHTYDGCRADYEALGPTSSICAFHDINDQFVAGAPGNNGGVPRFWNELKSKTHTPDQIFEFLDHSDGHNVMGIGLLVKGCAPRHA